MSVREVLGTYDVRVKHDYGDVIVLYADEQAHKAIYAILECGNKIKLEADGYLLKIEIL